MLILQRLFNMSASEVRILFSDLDLGAGDLAHSSWQQADRVPLNKYWSGVDAAEGRHAEARLLYSSEALLVRFECIQDEPLIINDKPSLTKKTIGLWEKD